MIKNSFIHIDTAEIKIPAGYKLESKPKDIFLETKFGNYKMSVQAEDDKIIYYRKREQNSARIPAKEYNDLVKYFEQVYKADRAKIVFVKSE
ncbi:MAG: DUF3858 domain-containing protein [Sphingobacteriales bacterium]|nr:DUF3858 domain-containing protein [Sphingobacteriales bacterium]